MADLLAGAMAPPAAVAIAAELAAEPERHDLPPLAEQIAELQREIETRKRFYPHWTKRGQIDPKVADERLLRIRGALETLLGCLRWRAVRFWWLPGAEEGAPDRIELEIAGERVTYIREGYRP